MKVQKERSQNTAGMRGKKRNIMLFAGSHGCVTFLTMLAKRFFLVSLFSITLVSGLQTQTGMWSYPGTHISVQRAN